MVTTVALLLFAIGCAPSSTGDDRFGGRVVRRDVGAPVITAPVTPTTAPTLVPPPYPVTWTPGPCPFPPASANGFTIDCGSLILPMKRAAATGKSVKIAVARIHSSSPTPQPDPVVYLEGGPGGSAISSVDRWTKPAAPLLENRDVILVDQRGTGYSEPRLTCEKFATDFLYTADLGSEALECLHKLRNAGADLSAFNTDESASDIADLRYALKLESWNLFGISYGTRLGLWIMKMHPQGIRTVVLDSVYVPGGKLFEETPANLDRAVQAVMADCAAQPACAGRYPDLKGQLARAIDGANKIIPHGGDDVVAALFDALYLSDVIPDIPKAISAGAAGDYRRLFNLLSGAGAIERHPEIKENAPPPSARQRPLMSDALYHSIECAEDAPLTTPEALRARSKDIAPQLRDSIVRGNLQNLALCNVWKMPAAALTDVQSDIPTLVLAGTYDPITPPAWGERAAKNLTRSKFVVVQGSGHAVWAYGDCPRQLVKLYIDDPAAPGPDCTGTPPEFTR